MERIYVETHIFPNDDEPTMYRFNVKVISLENGTQMATGGGGGQFGVPTRFGMSSSGWDMKVEANYSKDNGDAYCDVTIMEGALVHCRHRQIIDIIGPGAKSLKVNSRARGMI